MAQSSKVDLPVTRDGASALREIRQTLDAGPKSAGLARRSVREALSDAEHRASVDTVELLVSEIVTNAALHAHTGVELWVGVFPAEVCVEVRDFNPTLPVARNYDLEASTGRGMGLVAALAKAFGVQSLGQNGKVVWFCVDAESAERSASSIGHDWDLDELRSGNEDPTLTEIVLRSFPATLWLSARQHHDAAIRELVLFLAGHPELSLDVAAADAARALISTTVVAAIEAAHAAGETEPPLPPGHPSPLPWVPRRFDLRVAVPPKAAALFATLQDVLDAAERLANDNQLLVKPGLPEIIAVRDWVAEQVISQLIGIDPTPWPGTDQERFEHPLQSHPSATLHEWDSTVVTESGRGVIAADDANRIIAISSTLAETLQWEPADLVGRRVVSVIPPALREAHVAGFTRHLSTGEAHVIGVPLDLPVLRKDGSEITCRFVVEKTTLNDGRAVYLAWIDPLDPVPPARDDSRS